MSRWPSSSGGRLQSGKGWCNSSTGLQFQTARFHFTRREIPVPARTPQVIYATPKLHYPFGKDGRFHFPPIQRLSIYEKLDGTNVLAFRYRDAQGTTRVSYKLRLSAVLRNSKWGAFLDYWKELLARHP